MKTFSSYNGTRPILYFENEVTEECLGRKLSSIEIPRSEYRAVVAKKYAGPNIRKKLVRGNVWNNSSKMLDRFSGFGPSNPSVSRLPIGRKVRIGYSRGMARSSSFHGNDETWAVGIG